MNKIMEIASILSKRYYQETGEEISELKMHKLLYFMQKEYIAMTGEVLFDDDFVAYKHGPVNIKIRKNFKKIKNYTSNYILENNEKYIINLTLNKYGFKKVTTLVNLSHQDISYLNGLKNHNSLISKKDIYKDAENIRKIDYRWGNYYDE